MKHLTVITLVCFFACQPQTETTQSDVAAVATVDQSNDALSGAWKATDWIITNNETGETTRPEVVQYKLYVDGNVMWGNEAEPDSAEWFGYGTYEIVGDTLVEDMVSGSNAFRGIIDDQGGMFKAGLTISENSYTQTRAGEDFTVQEVYTRIR